MTAQTIRSKRFDWKISTFAFMVLLLATFAEGSVASSKLPIIQNVGVIPVQWEGAFGIIDKKDTIEHEFSAAVRATHRFRVLGDDLVAMQWRTERGRGDLRDQYESQGLISLTVAVREEVATMTMRLLNMGMRTELLETDTVSIAWLSEASQQDVKDRLESLAFRMVNRLPVDVSVTSVQGQFLTLSGGTEQNIAIGDKIDLIRSTIKSLHPANGTWLEFQSKPMGSAQVVDVKMTTSVARITKQTYDHAIEVGDGARISALSSRVKFARLAANEGLKDAGKPDTVIVSPIYVPGVARPAVTKTIANEAPAAQANSPVTQAELLAANQSDVPLTDGTPSPSQTTSESNAQEKITAEPTRPNSAIDENTPTLWDDISKEASGQRLVEHANFYTGPSLWRLGGNNITGTASKFPMLLINNVGGNVTRNLMYRIRTDFGAQLLSGSTTNGRFAGYRGTTRIYWESELPAIVAGFIHGWRGGGVANLQGLSVSGESFGGGDWVSGGGFIGLTGQIPGSLLGDRYDWQGEFSLIPLVIGRLGLAGKWQRIQSAFATRINLSTVQYRPPQVLAWGFGIDVGNDILSLTNGQTAMIRTYDLQVLAKYRF